MNFRVATLPTFEKEAKKLAKKYPSLKSDLAKLILHLETNPVEGIPLGNNFYKIRLAIVSKGKGKSGGARVITHIKIFRDTVFLAAIYDKSDKATISDAELKLLAKYIGQLG
jgi:mRNA-degrading endonuclease RelE of RelBE toxin-antitoxin system